MAVVLQTCSHVVQLLARELLFRRGRARTLSSGYWSNDFLASKLFGLHPASTISAVFLNKSVNFLGVTFGHLHASFLVERIPGAEFILVFYRASAFDLLLNSGASETNINIALSFVSPFDP